MEENTKNAKKVIVTMRREARENALKLLFEKEFQPDTDPEQFYIDEKKNLGLVGDLEYVKKVYDGVIFHKDELDALIGESCRGRRIARLEKAAATIMRIAVYEMKYYEDEHGESIAYAVSINEAVEAAKKYCNDETPGYVNGVLNAVADKLGVKEEK